MKSENKKDYNKDLEQMTIIIEGLKVNTNKLGVPHKLRPEVADLLAQANGYDLNMWRNELTKNNLLIGARGGSSESEQMTGVRGLFESFKLECIDKGFAVNDSSNPDQVICFDSLGERRLLSINLTNLDKKAQRDAEREKMLKK